MPSIREDNAFNDHMVKTVTVSLDSAIEWIQRNIEPSDVFSETELGYWALNNGYKKD